VWDRASNGAAAAGNAGLDRARGDIVVFCDDDVVPEPVVIERLLAHYAALPELAGLAPLIINYERPGWIGRLGHRIFRLGPFRDERQPVYWNWQRYPEGVLVPVRMFTGALMSVRRAALAGAVNATLHTRSSAPFRSVWAGLRGVRNDYAGSTFLAPRARTS